VVRCGVTVGMHGKSGVRWEGVGSQWGRVVRCGVTVGMRGKSGLCGSLHSCSLLVRVGLRGHNIRCDTRVGSRGKVWGHGGDAW